MASPHVLRNVRIFTGGADLTSQSNKVEIGVEYEEKDVTNFGSVDASGDPWKEFIAGMGSAKVTAGGQWEAGDVGKVDDDTWAALGGASAWTVYPHESTATAGGLPGSVAWIINAMRAQYQLGGSVGDVAPWAASASSKWPAVRGVGLHGPGTARTATGTGTAFQRPAVPLRGFAYASLNVLSVAGTAGPSITARLQSSANEAFTVPTDRHTFTLANLRGGQVVRVPGPLTDTWWRIAWTITGTTPSFLFTSAVGVK